MKTDKKRINLEETAAALRQQYPGVNIVAQSNNEYVVYSDDVINGGDIIDIMVPNDPWCSSENCNLFFPMEVYEILEKELDPRECDVCNCRCCAYRNTCIRHYKLKRFDYVSIIHDYIHGKLKTIQDLSLYTGDPLFDNSLSEEVYLWTPIIIYIIRQTLKIK